MLTTVIVVVTFLLALVLLAFSKQDMIKKHFSNQLERPASELQDQLELTADTVIKNLEGHILQLESLLAQADRKMEKMDETIRQSDTKLHTMGQTLLDTDQKINDLDEKISEAKVVNTVLANTQKAALMQLAQQDLSVDRNRAQLQEPIPLYQVREAEEKLLPQQEPLEKVVPYAFNQYQQQRENAMSAPELLPEEDVSLNEEKNPAQENHFVQDSCQVEAETNQAQEIYQAPQRNEMEEDAEQSVAKLSETQQESLEQDIAKLDQSIQQQRPVVLAMAKQGYTVTEISKVTGLGKGEILLFLELNKKL